MPSRFARQDETRLGSMHERLLTGGLELAGEWDEGLNGDGWVPAGSGGGSNVG